MADEGIAKRVVKAANGEGALFSYRFLVTALGFICAGLSGFIATAVVQQGQELAVLIDSRNRNLHIWEALQDTVATHTTEINAGIIQERQDNAYLQEQITQIQQQLQAQGQQLTNLGVAIARVRGARGPND